MLYCLFCRPQETPAEATDDVYEDVPTNKKKSKKHKSPPKSELFLRPPSLLAIVTISKDHKMC